jgi:hypothetical protein
MRYSPEVAAVMTGWNRLSELMLEKRKEWLMAGVSSTATVRGTLQPQKMLENAEDMVHCEVCENWFSLSDANVFGCPACAAARELNMTGWLKPDGC